MKELQGSISMLANPAVMTYILKGVVFTLVIAVLAVAVSLVAGSVLALVRKRGEETLVGLFNFTEYPAGASLDALGGKYKTADGKPVWLADVELEPYQALLVKNK